MLNRIRHWFTPGYASIEEPTFTITVSKKLSLPDIFNSIPLVQRIQLGKLAPRWSTYAAKSSLTLLIGDGAKIRNDTMFPENTSSVLSTGKVPLSPKETDLLLKHLPIISSFTVVMCHATEEQIGQLVRLLTLWSEKLTELNLFIDFEFAPKQQDDDIKAHLLHLIAAFNSWPSLKHLQIRLFGNLFAIELSQSDSSSKLELPILSRLEKFTFRSYDKASILVDSLVNFTQGNLHLGIYNWFNEDSAIRLLQLQPGIAQNMQRLYLSEWSPSQKQLRRLVDHFPNLRFLRLQLNGSSIPLPALARSLRPLKSLQSLELLVSDLTAHLRAIEEEKRKLEQGQEQILEALPGVDYFFFGLLDGSFASHGEFAYLHLHQMLPNVKKMIFYGDLHECDVCGDFGRAYGRHERSKDWRRVEKCILQQLAKPIQGRFPNNTEFAVI